MSLTLAVAQRILAAAAAKAEELDVRICIVVVDAGGLPIAMARMDGALPVAVQVAEAKALAAALWQRDGDGLKQMADGQPHLVGQLTQLPMLRGLPLLPALGSVVIRENAEFCGAIGVSGATASEDLLCAQAGLAALTPV
jgi:glc operon protein GlcG